MKQPVTRWIDVDPPLTGGRRADLLIHALAQLPEDIGFVASPETESSAIRTLARAYDVDHRLNWETRELSSSGHGESIEVSPPSPHPVPDLGWRALKPDGRRSDLRTMADLVELLRNGGSSPPRVTDDRVLSDAKVAVVTNIPAHYRIPLWNSLAQRLGQVGAELRVYFTGTDRRAHRDFMRPGTLEFGHEYLGFGGPHRPGVARSLTGRLFSYRPSVILAGGFAPEASGVAALVASRLGVPFGLWSGDISHQATASSGIRQPLRRWLVSQASFALAYGWLAREYLRSIDPQLPTIICRNSAPTTPVERRGCPSGTLEFLTIGHAEQRKRLDVAVSAFDNLRDLDCRLTVIGDGPTLSSLKAGAPPNVRFLGSVPSNATQEHLERADGFLFPSQADVFGLVLVEALGSGLATLVAPEPGAVSDLVADGMNGQVVASDDPRMWASSIRRLAGNRDELASLSRAASSTIQNRWTIEHSTEAWAAGLRLGMDTGLSGAAGRFSTQGDAP